jgi:Ser/Thr protein kinase RdoA (MazF antagonist)
MRSARRSSAGFSIAEQSALYGRAAAAIHHASHDFRSAHARFQIDLRHLLDEPLAAIRPPLAHRPEDWGYLLRLADRLRESLAALPAEDLDWGVCHGDLHGGFSPTPRRTAP